MLTKEQKKKYLKNSGKCPFCQSNNIEGGEVEIDGKLVWQVIDCLDCKKSWVDYYKLFDVEEKV